jgi:hypothetical protein
MDKFHSKLVSFLLPVTNTLAWANTLAYYGIRTLQVFIVQSGGGIFFSSLTVRQIKLECVSLTLFPSYSNICN